MYVEADFEDTFLRSILLRSEIKFEEQNFYTKSPKSL